MRVWLFLFVLCVVLFMQALFSSFFLSATADEFPHIESGYSALVTGDFRMETEHPPLLKVLSALPLFFLDLNFPKDHVSWGQRRHFVFYKEFIFEANPGKAALILFVARLPMTLLSVLLVLSVFWLTRKIFGVVAGLFAAFLVVFEPNILAQSNVVMTDLGFAFFCFLYVGCLFLFLQHPSWKGFFLTVVLFGLVQLTKFTAVFLVPLTVVLLVVYVLWRGSLKFPFVKKSFLNLFLLLFGLFFSAVLCINVAYLFSGSFLTLEEQFASDSSIDTSLYNPEAVFAHPVLRWVYESVPVPLPYPFVKGLGYVSVESRSPHKNYLFGVIRENGFKLYYVWSVLLKIPLPLLFLFVCAVFTAFRGSKSYVAVFFLIPVIFFIVVFSFSSKQNGIRYILQIIPFMIVVCAGYSSWLFRKKIFFGVLAVWLIVGSLGVFPNYVAYHNELVGSEQWPHVFADPNVEVGQNLDAVTAYLLEHNLSDARVVYAQKEDVRKYWPYNFESYYGCAEGVVVVDTVALHTVPELSYLLCLRPIAVVRDSVFVFNVTQCQDNAVYDGDVYKWRT